MVVAELEGFRGESCVVLYKEVLVSVESGEFLVIVVG